MDNKNCVTYMRYSTNNQTENSIDYQREAVAKYCGQNNLTLCQEYIDEAFSATNDRRPDFMRMMMDAQNSPAWDTILVYDFSRIFRNVKDATLYKAILGDCGIRVISVTEPLADSDEGWLTETLTDTLNEYYSRQTKRKTHAGMAVKAKEAIHCGGIAPLGYDVDGNGKLTINEAEAETVKEIFRLYDLGYSYSDMVKILNGKGFRTKVGKPFTKNSFYNILTQEKYTGTYRWNKRKAKNSKGKHNNHAYKPIDKQVVVSGGCPAIISPEQFQAVQDRLSEHKNGKADTKSRHHYMLGGLKRLKCAKCGAYMVGNPKTSHGKEYWTYACPNHRYGLCPTKEIRADELELYTAAVVVRSLMKKSSIPQLNQCLRAGDNSTEAQQLRSRLTGTEKKIDNLLKNLESTPSKALADRLRQLEQEKGFLTVQLKKASKPAPSITDKNIKKVRRELVNTLMTSNEPEVRELLMKHIDEISVSNEGVTVNLRI